jgi:protein-S-isoprenylcysteine O-methyltransferase Ste14
MLPMEPTTTSDTQPRRVTLRIGRLELHGWAAIVAMLNGALLLVVIPVLRSRIVPDSVTVTLIGIAIQIAAGTRGVWARRHLGRNWSGAITVAEDHHLFRRGPYRRL